MSHIESIEFEPDPDAGEESRADWLAEQPAVRSSRSRYRSPVLKEAFRISGSSDEGRDDQLREYLEAANFEIQSIGTGMTAIEARIAHYSSISFAFVTAPRVSIHWPRDEQSRERSLMVISRVGTLEVSLDGAYVRRGHNAILIPPGSTPVDITAASSVNELIYISAGAEAVPPAAAALSSGVNGPEMGWSRFVPLYAFVRSLCLTPVPPHGQPDLLAATAVSMVASCARMLVDGVPTYESTYLRALAYIDEYSASPHISVDSIARWSGVSRRTLQAAFAGSGTTVTEELRRARVRAVEDARQRHPHLTSEALSQHAGFASTSAMYRALARSLREQRSLIGRDDEVISAGEEPVA